MKDHDRGYLSVADLMQVTFGVLENAFRRLQAQVPPPKLTRIKGTLQLRYREKSIEQALVQKLARYISTLRAAQLLLRSGYFQEQGALQRILDELDEDILFLALAVTNDETTELHQRYLDSFYAEEFETPSEPVTTRRDMIPRKKIRAYISRIVGPGVNPSRDLAVAKTISKCLLGIYSRSFSAHNGNV
jgi:hypothetical protein